eukprot:scaffold109883_cov37-Tisochrysis_lutea.AAC.1
MAPVRIRRATSPGSEATGSREATRALRCASRAAQREGPTTVDCDAEGYRHEEMARCAKDEGDSLVASFPKWKRASL